jgi:hypothetical protein
MEEADSTAINYATAAATHDGIITAEQVLNLNPDMLTAIMGLQSVLSRGRNDGVASMVRVIQRQIKSLMQVRGEYDKNDTSSDDDDGSSVVMADVVTSSDEQSISRMNALPTTTTATTTIENENNHRTQRRPTVAMLLSGDDS